MEAEVERAARHGDVAREAMEHAPDLATALGPQDVERVVVRFARVDDHRHAQLAREGHLLRKDRPLHLARREVVVIIQANLPDGTHLRVASTRRTHQRSGSPRRRRLVCLVRMHANGEPRPVEPCRHADCLCRLASVARGEDAQHVRQPRLTHARQHVIEIRGEHGIGEVTVGVEHYR
jgi:hypothetical protein